MSWDRLDSRNEEAKYGIVSSRLLMLGAGLLVLGCLVPLGTALAVGDDGETAMQGHSVQQARKAEGESQDKYPPCTKSEDLPGAAQAAGHHKKRPRFKAGSELAGGSARHSPSPCVREGTPPAGGAGIVINEERIKTEPVRKH